MANLIIDILIIVAIFTPVILVSWICAELIMSYIEESNRQDEIEKKRPFRKFYRAYLENKCDNFNEVAESISGIKTNLAHLKASESIERKELISKVDYWIGEK